MSHKTERPHTNFTFSETDAKAEKKKRRKQRRRIILIIILVILAALLYFGLDAFFRLRSAFDAMFVPVGSGVANVRQQEGRPPLNLGEDPFSVLILGLDGPRADSVMVATVNPNLNSTYLLSIPRDTRVDIPGFWISRINHAHAYGGLDLMITVVQDFLDIPIDYFVTITDDHFHLLIDAFGGLRVYNDTVAFTAGGYHFPLGYVDLTGSSAYYYVRMRMQDPRGDFGRQERQRDVLQAMANEMAGVTVLTRYQQILGSVEDVLRTNVELNEMMSISMGYNRALRNIISLHMHYPGRIMERGMYLIPIPEESRLAMSRRLREHLELD